MPRPTRLRFSDDFRGARTFDKFMTFAYASFKVSGTTMHEQRDLRSLKL